MKSEIEIVPGVRGEPVFKTEAEYEAWRDEFSAGVKDELDAWREARGRSELAARFRVVKQKVTK